eukprot:30910-Pelagococcus_subviridis.AAC.12
MSVKGRFRPINARERPRGRSGHALHVDRIRATRASRGAPTRAAARSRASPAARETRAALPNEAASRATGPRPRAARDARGGARRGVGAAASPSCRVGGSASVSRTVDDDDAVARRAAAAARGRERGRPELPRPQRERGVLRRVVVRGDDVHRGDEAPDREWVLPPPRVPPLRGRRGAHGAGRDRVRRHRGARGRPSPRARRVLHVRGPRLAEVRLQAAAAAGDGVHPRERRDGHLPAAGGARDRAREQDRRVRAAGHEGVGHRGREQGVGAAGRREGVHRGGEHSRRPRRAIDSPHDE